MENYLLKQYVLRLKYECFNAEHMKQCFKCGPAFFTKFYRR